MVRRIHVDLVLPILREGGGQAGVAIAAGVVVLEIASARESGPAQEHDAKSSIRGSIVIVRPAALNGPRLRRCCLLQHVVAVNARRARLTASRLLTFSYSPLNRAVAAATACGGSWVPERAFSA
jgi:hypothetical protein